MVSIFLAFALFASTAFAEGIKSFSVSFEQNEQTYTGSPNKNTGTFEYLYPGQLKISLTKPFDEIYIITPKKVSKYSPSLDPEEPGQLNILKPGKDPLIALLDAFAEDFIKQTIFKAIKNEKEVILSLNEKQQNEYEVLKVVLIKRVESKAIASFEDISEIHIHKLSKRENIYKLNNFSRTQFTPKYFEFTPPAKTKVING